MPFIVCSVMNVGYSTKQLKKTASNHYALANQNVSLQQNKASMYYCITAKFNATSSEFSVNSRRRQNSVGCVVSLLPCRLAHFHFNILAWPAKHGVIVFIFCKHLLMKMPLRMHQSMPFQIKNSQNVN